MKNGLKDSFVAQPLCNFRLFSTDLGFLFLANSDFPMFTNLLVRGTYYVSINTVGSGAQWRRTIGQEIYSPLLLAFSQEDAQNWNDYHPSFIMMDLNYSLPNNVALTTLQELEDGSVILRLTHLYEASEDSLYSQVAKVELKKVFSTKKLMTEEELRQIDDATLSAISFGLETSTVPPLPGGQSAGGEPTHIDKGKGVATGNEYVQISRRRPSGISIRTESPIETPSAHEVQRESYVDLMTWLLSPEEEPKIPTIREVEELLRAYERTPNRCRRSTREEAFNPPSAAKRLHFDHPLAP